MSLYVRPWTVLLTFTDGTKERVQNVNSWDVLDGVLLLGYSRQVLGEYQVKHRGNYPIVNLRRWIKEEDL